MSVIQFIDNLMDSKITSSEDFFEELTNKNSQLWENPGSADAIDIIGVIEITALCAGLEKFANESEAREVIYKDFQSLYYDVSCGREVSLSEFLDNLIAKLRDLT